ncbi:MAG: hypothetical protein ACKVPX_09230 [Myxococcaceae bacterium]
MGADDVNKAARERAKQIAEERRVQRKMRRRACILCKAEESERIPLGPHPDGIGPSCRDEAGCQQRRASMPR